MENKSEERHVESKNCYDLKAIFDRNDKQEGVPIFSSLYHSSSRENFNKITNLSKHF